MSVERAHGRPARQSFTFIFHSNHPHFPAIAEISNYVILSSLQCSQDCPGFGLPAAVVCGGQSRAGGR